MRMIALIMMLSSVAVAQPGPAELEIAARPAVAAVASVPAPLPPSTLLDLIDLKPLRKPMYSWGVDEEVVMDERMEPWLVQYARITGSIGVKDTYTSEALMRASTIAAIAHVGVTLNTSPFHRVGGCNPNPMGWSDLGEEVAYVQEFMIRAMQHGLKVNAILLDSECYKVAHPMVKPRLDLVYNLVRMFFPDVPIFWYRNGDWAPNLTAQCDNSTVAWYRPYSAAYTELWLNKWASAKPSEKNWAVWVTLGSGYKPGGWSWDLGLDPIEYRYLGRMIAADNRINAALLYPGPYRRDVPGFHEAFVAFIQGATE